MQIENLVRKRPVARSFSLIVHSAFFAALVPDSAHKLFTNFNLKPFCIWKSGSICWVILKIVFIRNQFYQFAHSSFCLHWSQLIFMTWNEFIRTEIEVWFRLAHFKHRMMFIWSMTKEITYRKIIHFSSFFYSVTIESVG